MKRLDKFKSLESHPWLKKSYAKLAQNERDMAENFILNHNNLDKGEFEFAVNRMFLDRPKPKNWTIILEMLANSNSAI